MAAFPSDVNLTINNLSSIDKDNINYKENDENILTKSFNDKNNLLMKDQEYLSVHRNEENNYLKIYKKIWPYRVLKMTNFFLLLILAIGTSITASYSLWWSEYCKKLVYYKQNDLGYFLAFGQWILFFICVCSLIIHNFAKNKFLVGVFSLMDICLFGISILILSFSNIIFTIKSIAEYLWFGPKLFNFNYTIEEYVDLTEITSHYELTDYEKDNLNEINWIKNIVKSRKKTLFLNLLIDPITAVLTALLIILNILLIFILYKNMRKAKLWAKGLNNYKLLFPNCSLIEQKYSCHYPFGILKTTLWLLPIIIFVTIIYFPAMFQLSITHLLIPAIIYFIHWLLYYCTVHLNHNINDIINTKCLYDIFLSDLLISFIITLFFVVTFFSRNNIEALFLLIGAIFYGIYFLMLFCIYQRYDEKSFLNSLNFSIKFNIEINRNTIEEEKYEQDKNVEEIATNNEKEQK